MTNPTSPRRYENPPIEEALVEFQLVPTQQWDLTFPGKLHERVKEEYPGKPKNQNLLQADFKTVEGQPATVAVQESLARVQLFDATGKKMLAVGHDVISVHTLRPYEGWTQYRPRIERGLRDYATLLNSTQVSRVGVRYINRIELPANEEVVMLEDFFTTPPAIPIGLPVQLSSFLNRFEYVYDEHSKVFVTFASVPSPAAPTMLLDIDVVWQSATPVDIDDALKLVDELHSRESIAFESLITDKTREAFNV